MYCEKVICAGFGGQGVMSLGQLLAYAGMIEGKHVSWLPSYGPEMRGGTAYCCVMVSEQPIGSPLITEDATCAIVMNLPSLIKFEARIARGGLLLLNSSLIEQKATRTDLYVHYIPAVEAAVACGNGKMANMVMLGAYLEMTGFVRHASVIEAFQKVFDNKSKLILQQNSTALNKGAKIIQDQLLVTADDSLDD
ncbi:MAG: 2-oxoacid:acceptor oxidoreductase family protein [Desulfobacterales bacterium]|nr:2-oxoacid:acceptor oxidoreductase family protein [Desulfobacterales bacterium]